MLRTYTSSYGFYHRENPLTTFHDGYALLLQRLQVPAPVTAAPLWRSIAVGASAALAMAVVLAVRRTRRS